MGPSFIYKASRGDAVKNQISFTNKMFRWNIQRFSERLLKSDSSFIGDSVALIFKTTSHIIGKEPAEVKLHSGAS